MDMLGEFKDYGFSLREAGETTQLYYHSKMIADYFTAKLTAEKLQEGCRNYLKNISRTLEREQDDFIVKALNRSK